MLLVVVDFVDFIIFFRKNMLNAKNMYFENVYTD